MQTNRDQHSSMGDREFYGFGELLKELNDSWRLKFCVFIASVMAMGLHVQACVQEEEQEPEKPSVLFEGKLLLPDESPAVGCEVVGIDYAEGTARTVKAVSDAEGHYEIRLYGTFFYSPLVCTSSDKTSMASVQVNLNQEQNADLVKSHQLKTETLKPPRVTKVKVVDEKKRPVVDAEVFVQANFLIVAKGRTDEKGELVVRYPAGMRLDAIGALKRMKGIDFRAFEYGGGQTKTHPNLLAQDFDGDVELTLNGIREVSIEVLDPKGAPLPGVEIRPWLIKKPDHGKEWNLGGDPAFTRTTDAKGIALFDFLPIDQEWGVQFWPNLNRKDWFTVGNNSDFIDERAIIKWDEDPTATLRCLEKIKIGGKIRYPDGTAAKGIKVRIQGGFHYTDWYSVSATSDERGNWNALVKPDGFYLMVVQDKKWAAAAQDGIILRADEAPPEFDFELQPARRIFGKVTGVIDQNTRIMLQQRARNYYDLPLADQLPNPGDNRRAVSAFTQDSISVQKDGSFEFKVGPGNFTIWSPENKTENFVLDEDELEREFNFQSTRALRSKIKIKTLDFDTDEPIANAKVVGRGVDLTRGEFHGVTDKDGVIETERDAVDAKVYAVSQDKKFSGIANLEADNGELEILLSKGVEVTGTLIDTAGDPVANASLNLNIELRTPQGLISSLHSIEATTDEDGKFKFEGVTQGVIQRLQMVIGRDKSSGMATSWRFVHEFLPTDEDIDLGELRVEKPR